MTGLTVWERLLRLSVAGPFSGTWLSLGTALGSLVASAALRRLLPREERTRGGVTTAFLALGLLLGLIRLTLVAAGAGNSAAGRAISLLTTFFVAMGAIGVLLMFAFEVVPSRARMRFPSIVRDLLQLVAFAVILFGVLSQSGVHVLSLITTSAVLTAVIGLALQSTIANLFAGIVLHMDRDLGVDDWVQVGQRTGRISEIRWRSTILRTTDGDTVILPNGQLIAQEVYNFSRPSTRHRRAVRVGFHYQHPPNDVRRVLTEAVLGAPGVMPDPAPDCYPVEFGDSAVIYALRFWIDSFAQHTDIEGEVRVRVWYAARRAGFEVAYPTRTLHMQTDNEGTRASAAAADLAQRVAALERVDLFAPLEPFERQTLARAIRRVRFARGEAIIRQGDPGDSLFLVAEGQVRVSIAQGGISQEVALLAPWNFFGEMSLMTGEPRTATCTAGTDVVCYVIDHAAFHSILTLRPQIADEMSYLLATRQVALGHKGDELAARAALAADRRKHLLARIRSFFALG